jgi:hypothetical protein
MNKFTIVATVFAFLAVIFAIAACAMPKWYTTEYSNDLLGDFKVEMGPFRYCSSLSMPSPIPGFPISSPYACSGITPSCETGFAQLDSTLCSQINASRAFLVIGILTCVATIVLLIASFFVKTATTNTRFVMYLASVILNGFGFVCYLISFAVAAGIFMGKKKELPSGGSLELGASFYLTMVGAIFLLVGTIVSALKRRPDSAMDASGKQQLTVNGVDSAYHNF